MMIKDVSGDDDDDRGSEEGEGQGDEEVGGAGELKAE